MNFILANMIHLKYFIPLVIEGNKRGIESHFFTYCPNENEFNAHKDSSGHPYNFTDGINAIGKVYGFDYNLFAKDDAISGLTFCAERRGIFNLSDRKDIQKVVLVCLKDFINKNWYDAYIKVAQNVIFPSEFFAKYYNKVNEKNLYLGSPKYDIDVDAQHVREKYNIRNNKNALVLYPHNGTEKDKLEMMDSSISHLKEMGYDVIVKTKKRWPSSKEILGDYYFEEFSWFPHSTMELFKVCDIVVGSDSSVIKECVMFDKPFINVHIAPFGIPFPFLYDYEYTANFNKHLPFREFSQNVERLTSTDLSEEFIRARKNHLFEKGNVSSRILSHFEGNNEN